MTPSNNLNNNTENIARFRLIYRLDTLNNSSRYLSDKMKRKKENLYYGI